MNELPFSGEPVQDGLSPINPKALTEGTAAGNGGTSSTGTPAGNGEANRWFRPKSWMKILTNPIIR